jgi:hypothetical protein
VLAGIRDRLTYANVVSTLCLFLLLGGGAYAAFSLPRNSVKSRNIVNGQVKTDDIRPSRVHGVGLPIGADPGSISCSGTGWITSSSDPVGYYRDPLGEVHLIGLIGVCDAPANPVFTLPEGFRPAADDVALPVSNENVVRGNIDLTTLSVHRNGTVSVQAHDSFDLFSLNGLSFRCGPSGADGCP